jgi:hypothetical protein
VKRRLADRGKVEGKDEGEEIVFKKPYQWSQKTCVNNSNSGVHDEDRIRTPGSYAGKEPDSGDT